MSARRWTTGLALAAAVAAATGGVVWTRDRGRPPAAGDASAGPQKAPARAREWRVDMGPLLTARRLAALATTSEEQELA
ncbi:MAG TPA: hypothetical protein VMK12_00625, partial [Anaeromyxobacteraceae bacterium]|nr:hypothetical protein [Anaeromyxobacteraceae bacterium]